MKAHVALKNPLAQKAWTAIQKAVAETVDEHHRHGRPLAIWRSGKVVWVESEPTAVIREKPANYKTRGQE
jgi:hypothetical protein